MLKLPAILLVLTFVSWSSAAVLQEPSTICPPADLLAPCTCSETLKAIDCSNINGRFNIKSIFDSVTPFVDPSFVFNTLTITKTSLIELPSNAISELKFLEISITSNTNLEYIYYDAFTATKSVTKKLSLNSNHLTNVGAEEDDIFHFARSFSNLEILKLAANSLTSIPSRAFHSMPLLKELSLDGSRFATVGEEIFDLPSLTKLSMYSSSITVIPENGFGPLPELLELDLTFSSVSSLGKNAFIRSPKLTRIDLQYNSLTDAGIHEDAFNGLVLGDSTVVDLRDNHGLTYLPEPIFKDLISNSKTVAVGGQHCNRNGCTTQYLTCDEQADWICQDLEGYRSVLSGFRCRGGGYGDVWGYCATLSE